MTWVWIIALALAVLVLAIFVLRAPRIGWEAIVAVLLIGLAGYAFQGRPDLAAAPHAPDTGTLGEGAMLVADRQLIEGMSVGGSPLVVVSDAYLRHGDYAAAAELLSGVVARDPRDGAAWLALGNALVAQAGGALSPAALYAYRQAQAAAPADAGVPYFMGLALAANGDFVRARGLWAGALAKAPADAKWRPVVAQRLARLDAIIAAAAQMQARPAGGTGQVDGPGN